MPRLCLESLIGRLIESENMKLVGVLLANAVHSSYAPNQCVRTVRDIEKDGGIIEELDVQGLFRDAHAKLRLWSEPFARLSPFSFLITRH